MKTAWRLLVGYWLCASAAPAANLLPNSSFEVGAARGWIAWGGAGGARGGNQNSYADCLNSDHVHGTKSFEVASRLVSRSVRLDAGTYTFSGSIRCPANITVWFGVMNASQLDAVPAATITATNGWQRFSQTVTVGSNALYHVKIYHVSDTIYPLVDALQLETGSSATAYAPACSIEMGLDTADPYNLILSGDAQQFRLRYWNDGGPVTVTGECKLYDLWNRVVATYSISQLIYSGATTAAVDLPATNGWLRLTSRLFNCNDSWDETAISVLPWAADTTRNTNGILGTHPAYFSNPVKRERRGGFTFGRDLSPSGGVRWSTVEPTSNNFVWNDAVMLELCTNGLVPICNLNPSVVTDGTWQPWATNADGSANFAAYTNYVGRTVARYSVAPYNVHHWETLNEPQNFLSNPDFRDQSYSAATNLAHCLDMTVKAIRDADPDAYIIALGGMNSATYQGWIVWTNLLSATQTKINAVSCHLYPNDNNADPNAAETDSHYSSPREWALTFQGIKPVINTESGTWSVGGYKGLNSMLQGNYDLSSAPALEASRIEPQARHQASVDRSLVVALRCLGWGMRYINYWSQHFNDQLIDLAPTDPTVLEYNASEKPNGVALLMTIRFAGLGFGLFTNVNDAAGNIELFQFTNMLGTSIAAWTDDRSLQTLTLTNANVALYDCMGNLIQTGSVTIPLNRTPRYIVFASLTQSQASNTVKYASVASATDTTAPNVSVDIAPSGNWDGTSMLRLAKWTVNDENKLLWPATGPHTNLVSKWHLDSDSYTAYSASNHGWLPAMANGNHTLYVTALDSAGNSREVSYSFGIDSTPTTAGFSGGHPLLLKRKSIGALPVTSAGPSYLVHQDFEGTGYDNGETWSEAGTGTMDEDYTGVVLDGLQSLRLNLVNQSAIVTNAFVASDEIWIYFLMRVVSQTANAYFFSCLGSAPSACDAYIDGAWRLNFCGDLCAQPATAITSNVTYHVWMHYKKGAGFSSINSIGFSTDGIRPTSGGTYAEQTSGNRTQPIFKICFPKRSDEGSVSKQIIYDKVRVSITQIGDNPP